MSGEFQVNWKKRSEVISLRYKRFAKLTPFLLNFTIQLIRCRTQFSRSLK